MNSKSSRESQDLLQDIENPDSELRQLTRSILKGRTSVDALNESKTVGGQSEKRKSASSSKSISSIVIFGVAAIGLVWIAQFPGTPPIEPNQTFSIPAHGIPLGQTQDFVFKVGISPNLGGDETPEAGVVENRQITAAIGNSLHMQIRADHPVPFTLIRIRDKKISTFRHQPSRIGIGSDNAIEFGPFNILEGKEIWWAIATQDFDVIDHEINLKNAFLFATPDAQSRNLLLSSLTDAGIDVRSLDWLVVNWSSESDIPETPLEPVAVTQEEQTTRSETELYREKNRIERALCEELDEQAGVAFDSADYEKAERLSRKTLEIKTEIYGKDHVKVAQSQSNLAAAYIDSRKYESARRLLQPAIRTFRTRRLEPGYNGENDGDFASALNNLGSLQNSTREFGYAIRSLKESMAVYQELYRGKTMDQMDGLSDVYANLGFAYETSGRLEQAQHTFEKATEIDQHVFDNATRPTVRQAAKLAMSLNSLATVTSKQGDHPAAEKLLLGSLAKLGKDSVRRITVLVNLTRIAGELQNKKEDGLKYAQECFDLATRIYDEGETSEHVARASENLAIARWWFDDDKEGIYELAKRGAEIRTQLAIDYFMNSTEPQCLNYSIGQFGSPGLPITFGSGLADNVEEIYELVWNRRGLLQGILSQRNKLFDRVSDNDPQLLNEMMAIDRMIAINLRDEEKQLRELTAKREQLTATMLAKYGGQSVDDDWKPAVDDLRKSLPSQSAFVDVVSYLKPLQQTENGTFPAISCYGAFVVQSNSVQFLELGSTDEVDADIEKWLQSIEQGKEVDTGVDVARRVWFPLQKLLENGTNTLFMCCDGAMSHLPWAALPSDETGSASYLIRNYTFASCADGIQLTRGLAGKNHHPDETNLHTYSEPIWAGNTLLVSDVPVEPWKKRGLDYPALTPVESRLVRILQNGTDGQPVPVSGNSATVDEFERQIDNCSNVILWSHAFVYEPAEQENHPGYESRDFTFSREMPLDRFPLTKSAFLLACPESLTGQFVSTLDLTHIDTVLLMGCGTACGDRFASEGVAGFQLAFNRAGVKTSIASLWNANEIVAGKFVEAYFENLRAGKSKVESFRLAQIAVLDDRSADNHLPKHWACWKFCGQTQF